MCHTTFMDYFSCVAFARISVKACPFMQMEGQTSALGLSTSGLAVKHIIWMSLSSCITLCVHLLPEPGVFKSICCSVTITPGFSSCCLLQRSTCQRVSVFVPSQLTCMDFRLAAQIFAFYVCICEAQLADVMSSCRWQGSVVSWMVDDISKIESKAERSLMHRFNLARVSTQMPLLHASAVGIAGRLCSTTHCRLWAL